MRRAHARERRAAGKRVGDTRGTAAREVARAYAVRARGPPAAARDQSRWPSPKTWRAPRRTSRGRRACSGERGLRKLASSLAATDCNDVFAHARGSRGTVESDEICKSFAIRTMTARQMMKARRRPRTGQTPRLQGCSPATVAIRGRLGACSDWPLAHQADESWILAAVGDGRGTARTVAVPARVTVGHSAVGLNAFCHRKAHGCHIGRLVAPQSSGDFVQPAW